MGGRRDDNTLIFGHPAGHLVAHGFTMRVATHVLVLTLSALCAALLHPASAWAQQPGQNEQPAVPALVSPQVVIVGHDPDVPNVEIRSNFIPVMPWFLAPPVTGAIGGFTPTCVAGAHVAAAPSNVHATARAFPPFPTDPALSIGSLASPSPLASAGIPAVACQPAPRMRVAPPRRR
jgi:hypothetical protein